MHIVVHHQGGKSQLRGQRHQAGEREVPRGGSTTHLLCTCSFMSWGDQDIIDFNIVLLIMLII